MKEYTFSYKYLPLGGTWSKKGIRVKATCPKEATEKVTKILLKRGKQAPFLFRWNYVV